MIRKLHKNHQAFTRVELLVRSLVSADKNGNPPVNAIETRNVRFSDKPLMSADGRWIAFQSFATNLTSETDLNSETDVFLTGETLAVVSNLVADDHSFPTRITAMAFSISADGRWVTYPANGVIMVADMQTAVQTNLTPSDSNWTAPVISGDGRYVTYGGIGSRAGSLLIADLSTAERSVISSNYLRGAAFSLNSEHLVYSASEGSAKRIRL